MIKLKSFKNQEGIALPVVLMVMLLLLALSAAAMVMSHLGYTSLTSDIRYQRAEKAADAGLNDVISRVLPGAQCPASTGSPVNGTVGNASYSAFSINDANYTSCLVYSTGTFGNAKVIKVAVVPRAGTDWGGLRILGGRINLSGSSAIAGCDDDENTYSDRCGVVSGVIYSGSLSYQQADVSSPLINCTGEGPLKGFEGNPPLQQVPSPTQNELLAKYFNVTDQNNNDDAWDELMERIEIQKNIEFYPNLPTTPVVNPTGQVGCDYVGGASCSTTSVTTINCGGTVINLNTCDAVYVTGALTIGHKITNKEIRVANTVAINETATNLNIKSNNTVTISQAISNSLIQANLVAVNQNVSNSTIISARNINFSTSKKFNISNSKLISGGSINVGGTGNQKYSGIIENSDFFANLLNFNLSTQSEIRGGIFYANGGVTIDTQGALNFGTVTNPVLLLSEGTSAISMPGNFTFNGFIYTYATQVNITGAVELQGMIVNASSNATINNTGNGTIQFQKQVLDNLYKNLKTAFGGTPLLREAQCGAGNKRDYIGNTKVTIY